VDAYLSDILLPSAHPAHFNANSLLPSMYHSRKSFGSFGKAHEWRSPEQIVGFTRSRKHEHRHGHRWRPLLAMCS